MLTIQGMVGYGQGSDHMPGQHHYLCKIYNTKIKYQWCCSECELHSQLNVNYVYNWCIFQHDTSKKV